MIIVIRAPITRCIEIARPRLRGVACGTITGLEGVLVVEFLRRWKITKRKKLHGHQGSAINRNCSVDFHPKSFLQLCEWYA